MTTPISAQGKAFTDASGKRFIVRGVALSSNNIKADLLADDYYDYMKHYVLPALLALNVNMVRVYQVHGSNHSKVMKLLADNSICAMVGLVDLDVSINRNAPVYTQALEDRVCSIASEFCNYENTFAFSVGNEVVFPGEIYAALNSNGAATNETILTDALVMRLLIKSLKAYMKANSLRMVPVGMAMQDGDTSTLSSWSGIGTDLVAQFYASGHADERADFIGINTYAYVPGGPMNAYDRLAQEVTGAYLPVEGNVNLPIPVFLSETGGMTAGVVRDWAIVPQMYTEALLYNNLSGQVAFQFFNKRENMGLYIEQPSSEPNPLKAPYPALSVTTYGGEQNLATQFTAVKTLTVPMPALTPGATDIPPALQPTAQTPFTSSLVMLTFYNSAPNDLLIVQNGTMVAKLPAASATAPSVINAVVLYNVSILIQQPGTWDLVCTIPAASVVQGAVFNTAVSWGSTCGCGQPATHALANATAVLA